MKKRLFFCIAIGCGIIAGNLKAQDMPKLPLIAIISTGGTIAEKTDPKTGAAIPYLSGEELVNTISTLKKYARYKVINFSNIDSSQMTPAIWSKLSKTIDQTLEDREIVGAVITHGTDTMAEGAFFLELTLKTKKPVVMTGAMRSSSDPSPDGPVNLTNSVIQILSKQTKDWGVTINMNQFINSARDAIKTHTTNPQTFESGERGYLGYVINEKVYRFNDQLYRMTLPIPQNLPRVDLIVEYPGTDGSQIRYAVDNGAKGIVIESLGAGNVCIPTYEAIKYAIEKKVAIVVSSSVFYGGVFPLYGDEGGGESLQKLGAILTGCFRGSKARLLLILALPLVGEDYSKLNQYFCQL